MLQKVDCMVQISVQLRIGTKKQTITRLVNGLRAMADGRPEEPDMAPSARYSVQLQL